MYGGWVWGVFSIVLWLVGVAVYASTGWVLGIFGAGWRRALFISLKFWFLWPKTRGFWRGPRGGYFSVYGGCLGG